MAYTLYYTANFNDEANRLVEVSIFRKDGAPIDVVNIDTVDLSFTDNGETQDKYNWIIMRQLELILSVDTDTPITWETFVADDYTDWKITVLIDSMPFFEGWIMPDEGSAPFLDPPYDITIKATNGLALLREKDLVDVNGIKFNDDNSLISYIAGALKQTGLELPIRTRCSYLFASMLNKGNGLEYDMFSQAFLNYGTFLSDATTFNSCFDSLKRILNGFCVLEYWNGMWQITCLADRQYVPGDWFYVDYDANGENSTGAQELENYAQVGKSVDIYPINENQEISSQFAANEVKTVFKFEINPELPKNNKFDRGDFVSEGPQPDEEDNDGDGNTSEIIGTYKLYDVADWDIGQVDLFDAPAFILSAPEGNTYIRRIYNPYGIETKREILMETPTSSGTGDEKWMRSKPIPVRLGDILRIRLGKRYDTDFTGGGSSFTIVARAYIILPGGGTTYYSLTNVVDGVSGGKGVWILEAGTPPNFLAIDYVEDQNSTKYATIDVETLPIPVNGTFYIAFAGRPDPGTVGARQFFTDFNLEYLPFISNGYLQVQASTWTRTQAKTFPDKIEHNVQISDTVKPVLKGSLLFVNDLVNVETDGNWYRFHSIATPNPTDEHRQFTELLNIGQFNDAYRRMYKISGDFDGVTYAPDNDQLSKKPIGFHKTYRFVDMTSPRDFVLVPPLKINVGRGWIEANFQEVSAGDSDGTQTGTGTFNYKFQ
ncbi:hypothetical protein [Paraflavitalea pollutisoli]|uniref:hypothetical protein n=1 Tax=Paraflavitalea pollutisoli TaxID=3034143 RepID=UPI0023EAC33B|nr:hypothetical protein [Paraflavitalea sp. H1-2-19X]